MPSLERSAYYSPTDQLVIGQFMSKVYMWMTIGILLTGVVAMTMAENAQLMGYLLGNRGLFYLLIFAEFGLVLWLSARIHKMAAGMATGMFLFYAALNGVTLSVFSLVYTHESIQSAFFTTAASFAGLSAWGFFTKKDLGPVGSFCSMGLFGLIGFGLLSWFFPSMMGTTASKVYSLVGIIVFAGLTAYDTQMLKRMGMTMTSSGLHRGAILGALKLYLDFINLFLFILRMSGRRR
jgi:uncharacterized protein